MVKIIIDLTANDGENKKTLINRKPGFSRIGNWLSDFFDSDDLFNANLVKMDWILKVNTKEEKDRH